MKSRITSVLFSLMLLTAASYSQVANVVRNGVVSEYVPGDYYFESFEDSLPKIWNVMNADEGSSSWNIFTSMARSGSTCIGLFNESGRTDDWLITPQYAAYKNDSLVFYVRSTYAAGGNDTLLVMESDSAYITTKEYGIKEAFTDTLLAIDVTKLSYASPSDWRRFAVSLKKYAGKQIYLAFRKSADSPGSMCIDDVGMGVAAEVDIQLMSFDMNKYGAVGDSLSVRVRYYNKGSKKQSFSVALDVPGLGDFNSPIVQDVEPDDIGYATVKFESSKQGVFEMRACHNLLGDSNPGNDIIDSSIIIFGRADSMKWLAETDLPEVRKYSASAYVLQDTISANGSDSGFVYLMGGDDIDGNMSNSIFKYNPVMKTWEKLSYPMHKSLHYFNAVQISGKIYMGGGQSKLNTYENAFVSLDLETEEYTDLAAMPSGVYGYALGTYGDSLIYIMGGCTDVNPGPGSFHFTTAVQVYNIKTNEWKLATPFTGEPRMSIAGAICGNTIVLAGGYGDYSPYYSNAVEVGIIDPKDPYTIAWGQSEYPAGEFSQLMAGSWEGKHKKFVYFTGGYAKNVYSMGDVFSVKTWIYDVQQNAWLAGPDKISHVENPANMAVVVRNDSVFMAAAGGLNHIDYTRRTSTELLYIGKDEPYDFTEKDIAAVSIDVADTLYVNMEITPAASFTNNRSTPQVFSVTMEITPGSYKSSAVVSSLEYNSIKQAAFPKWTPETTGTYTVKVYLSVEGDGNKSNDTLSSTVIVRNTIGITNEDMAPAVYSLNQNYPNPFNPSTVINYSIAEAGKVELKIYNMLGQEITTLVNEMKNAGRHEVKFNAAGMNLSSGVYIYRIKSGSFVQTKKLMLIK